MPRKSKGYVGRKAAVIASSGFHSRQYLGRTGVAAAKMSTSGIRWVIRFSSVLPDGEQGLYDDNELDWV